MTALTDAQIAAAVRAGGRKGGSKTGPTKARRLTTEQARAMVERRKDRQKKKEVAP